jgi:hypothetical protein
MGRTRPVTASRRSVLSTTANNVSLSSWNFRSRRCSGLGAFSGGRPGEPQWGVRPNVEADRHGRGGRLGDMHQPAPAS